MIRFKFDTFLQQTWSLPEPVINRIAKNPFSFILYSKLAKSCKYFFDVNPILVVDRLDYCDGFVSKTSKLCSKSTMGCDRAGDRCCLTFNGEYPPHQIWITSSLTIMSDDFDIANCIRQSDSSYLFIRSWNNPLSLSFKSLKPLISSTALKRMDIKCLKSVIDDGGNMIRLEHLLHFVPNIKEMSFCYWYEEPCQMLTCNTLKNLTEMNGFGGNLLRFTVGKLPESSNISDLYAFIEKFHRAVILLKLDSKISSRFKDQLELLIDHILGQNFLSVIQYDGQDVQKLSRMHCRLLSKN